MQLWYKTIIIAGLFIQANMARSQDAPQALNHLSAAGGMTLLSLPITELFPSDSSVQLPRKLPQDLWLGKDKFDHALVSAGLVASQFYILHQELEVSRGRSRQIAAGSALFIGIAKEIYDKVSRRGTPSWKDLLADLAGVALAVGIMTQ